MFRKERLAKIKLVVADLDGTLLDNTGSITAGTKGVIKELENKGLMFAIASGRLHSALKDYIKELNIVTPVISLDGSLIKSEAENKTLFQSIVPKKYVLKAINFADKLILNVALCHADAAYYTERNSVVPQVLDKFGVKYVEVGSYDNYLENVLEIAMASDYKDKLKYVYNKMNFPYSSGLKSFYYKSESHKGIYYLEIRKKGSDKGKALIKLCKYLKVKLSETAVIGDWHNDISMFNPKAVKVTLSNGIPELKNLADMVINKTNDEEGAREFLEMLLKAKS